MITNILDFVIHVIQKKYICIIQFGTNDGGENMQFVWWKLVCMHSDARMTWANVVLLKYRQ